jgi:hypothetical protein
VLPFEDDPCIEFGPSTSDCFTYTDFVATYDAGARDADEFLAKTALQSMPR